MVVCTSSHVWTVSHAGQKLFWLLTAQLNQLLRHFYTRGSHTIQCHHWLWPAIWIAGVECIHAVTGNETPTYQFLSSHHQWTCWTPPSSTQSCTQGTTSSRMMDWHTTLLLLGYVLSSRKIYFRCFAAELIYGTGLRLPGEFFCHLFRWQHSY